MKSRRIAACLFFAVLGTGASGCFALFSLDDYGPPVAAVDAGTDTNVVPVADTGPPPESSTPSGPTKRVFITSTPTTGKLGGLNGADNACQLLASSAKLSGTYKAWLSKDGETPRTRFFAGDAGLADFVGARLVDVTGTTIATSYASLFESKTLLAPIDRNEQGVKLGAADGLTSNDVLAACAQTGQTGRTFILPVWTNTTAEGEQVDSEADCGNFQNETTQTRVGIVGITESWTSACALPCSIKARLYCFEQ